MVSIREMITSRIKRESIIKHNAHVSFIEMLTPAIAGGIIIGLMLGIPGINLLIPLVAFGGYFSVRLVREYYEKYVTMPDAFKVGAFAGFIGGFIGTALFLMIGVFYADGVSLFVRGFLDFKTADMVLILSGIDPYLSLTTLKLRFLANLAIGVGIGGIGGGYYIRSVNKRRKIRKKR